MIDFTSFVRLVFAMRRAQMRYAETGDEVDRIRMRNYEQMLDDEVMQYDAHYDLGL